MGLTVDHPILSGNGGYHAPAKETSHRPFLQVEIDAFGTIQSTDGDWPGLSQGLSAGSTYFGSLGRICGGDSIRAEAVRVGIQAINAGAANRFGLDFSCRLPSGEVPVHLEATANRSGALKGVWLTLTGDAPIEDPQEYKLEALGRLAGGVAHDFANLLTLISGYSDILLNSLALHDSNRPALEEIRRAAARGAGVTAQILDFIRKRVAPPGGVQLNSLVTEMVKLLRPIIGEHVSLAVSLDPELGTVNAELAQISRVVMNLMMNARDAMPLGGTIRIRTANMQVGADFSHGLAPGRYVMLEVSDTGTGMDRETLRRVFQPFFTTKERRGTGLGLSTVHRIVEQAGGAIWAHSEPGEGSTFTVCMPLTEGGVETVDDSSGAGVAGRGTETILLAEDEDSVRKLLSHVLDSNGYRVLEASDGHAALRVFEQNAAAIDLLLTDVIMPGMNGRDLVEKVRAAKPGLKVIYMSGYTDDVLVNTGVSKPGISFLRKPLKLHVLSALIREVLDAPGWIV